MGEFVDKKELQRVDEIDVNEIDDDEIDLLALVSANANNTSQFLIFEGSDEQYYAKNVSKIEELLVYKELDVAKTHQDGIVIGTADVRGEMVTLVYFDKWIGNKVLDDSEYELVILSNYGGHKLGIVIKRVEYIVNIPPESMTNTTDDEKISFVTKVTIGKDERMCLIYDSDKFLLDVFDNIDEKAETDTQMTQKIKNDRIVLFADDSRFIRKMVEKLFEQMGLRYKIYENGKDLYEDLKSLNIDDVALVVTDLEMPVMGGVELIGKIREDKRYDDINIIVHTNMANYNMKDSLFEMGVKDIIGKVNMLALGESVGKFIR